MTESNHASSGDPDDVPFGAMIFGDPASSKGRESGPAGPDGDRRDWRRSENRRGHGRRGGRRRRRPGQDGEAPLEGAGPRADAGTGASVGDAPGAVAPRDDAASPRGGGAPEFRERAPDARPERSERRPDDRGPRERFDPRRERDARAPYEPRPPRDGGAPNAERGPAADARAPVGDPQRREQGERPPDGFADGGGARDGGFGDGRQGRRRRRRRGRGGRGGGFQDGGPRGPASPAVAAVVEGGEPRAEVERPRDERVREPRPEREALAPASGMLVLEKGHTGYLRRFENDLLGSNDDVFVPQSLVARYKLRDGSVIEGPIVRGGPSKHQLQDVTTVDGQNPREIANLPAFKRLTSIDPDFHYAVGDPSGDVNLKILDLLCPIGRGTRGLLVAPPRSGKTILMRKFAKAIEDFYPDVELIVLLVD